MRRVATSLVTTALLTTVGAGCDPGPSCEGTLTGEVSKDPIPPSWAQQGVAFAPGAVVCAGATDRDVLVVERTTDPAAARASRARDQLVGTGWTVVPGKEGPSSPNAYSITLERGAEALVMSVFPVLDPMSKPALAIMLGIVPKRRP